MHTSNPFPENINVELLKFGEGAPSKSRPAPFRLHRSGLRLGGSFRVLLYIYGVVIGVVGNVAVHGAAAPQLYLLCSLRRGAAGIIVSKIFFYLHKWQEILHIPS